MKHNLKPQPRRCGYCGEVIIGKLYRLMPLGTIPLCALCKVISDALFQSPRIQPRRGTTR